MVIGKFHSWVAGLFALLAAAASGAHEHAPAPRTQALQKQWERRLAEARTLAHATAIDERGVLWKASVKEGHVWVSHSADGGKSFSPAVRVNETPEAIQADGDNRPRLSVGGGVVALAWAQALPKRFAGHVRFARSTDGGKRFSSPITINSDPQEIGHSFVAMSMHEDGHLVLAWLDSRDRAAAAAGRAHRGSSVYYAVSADRGANFSPDARLASHSCECCRIALTHAPSGAAVALWRHVFEDGSRDFALAELRTDTSLTRASQDGWKIQACPHHGGDLAIAAGGRTHLAWFTGATGAAGLFYRYLEGAKWREPLPFGNNAAQAGHPAVHAQGNAVHLAWREFDGARFNLWFMRSLDGGENWSAPRSLASGEGPADQPLFVAQAKRPLLAWFHDQQVEIFDLETQQ